MTLPTESVYKCMGDHERGKIIDLEDLLDPIHSDIQMGVIDSGIVDKDVDRPVQAPEKLCTTSDILQARKVCKKTDTAHAILAFYMVLQTIRPIGVPVNADQIGTLSCKEACSLISNSRGCTGNDCQLASRTLFGGPRE